MINWKRLPRSIGLQIAMMVLVATAASQVVTMLATYIAESWTTEHEAGPLPALAEWVGLAAFPILTFAMLMAWATRQVTRCTSA